MREPRLGTTFEEALRGAYRYGYERFDHLDARHVLPDDVELSEALDVGLHTFESVRLTATESQENKRLWWAIEDFYEEHMPQEEYERLQREAAVAEDLDTAFMAGYYAAIRNEPCNPDDDLWALETRREADA